MSPPSTGPFHGRAQPVTARRGGRLRATVAAVVAVLVVAAAGAAAAQDAGPGSDPAPEPTASPAAIDGDETTPVTAPTDAAAVGQSAGDAGDAGDASEAPPRCGDGQVDLAPDDEVPNCIAQVRLTQLLGGFEAAAADEARALASLTGKLDEIRLLQEELDRLARALADAQVRLAAAEADARFAALRGEVARQGLEDVEAALVDEQDQLRDQAVDAYMGSGGLELAVTVALFDIDSAIDVEAAREYADSVIGDQAVTIGRVQALREATATMALVVARLESEADAGAARADELEAIAAALLTRQQELVAAAAGEASALAEEISAIQSRKSTFARELQVSGAGGGSIGAVLARLQADRTAPEEIEAILALPLVDTRIGSPFGPRVHPIFSDARLHTGVDLSGVAGQPITASADGVVVIAEEVEGYGNVVVVDHGDTLATLYAHMTADAVAVGDEVERGELLGFVGSTGWSTGPHLHFEVRIGGQPVDPLPFLDFGDDSAARTAAGG